MQENPPEAVSEEAKLAREQLLAAVPGASFISPTFLSLDNTKANDVDIEPIASLPQLRKLLFVENQDYR